MGSFGDMCRRFIAVRIPLRRVFFHVTLICVIAAGIAQHPDAVVSTGNSTVRLFWLLILGGVRAVLLLAPPAIVCWYIGRRSRNSRFTLLVSGLGVILGMSLSPGICSWAEQVAMWWMGLRFRWMAIPPLGLIDHLLPSACGLMVGLLSSWAAKKESN